MTNFFKITFVSLILLQNMQASEMSKVLEENTVTKTGTSKDILSSFEQKRNELEEKIYECKKLDENLTRLNEYQLTLLSDNSVFKYDNNEIAHVKEQLEVNKYNKVINCISKLDLEKRKHINSYSELRKKYKDLVLKESFEMIEDFHKRRKEIE